MKIISSCKFSEKDRVSDVNVPDESGKLKYKRTREREKDEKYINREK